MTRFPIESLGLGLACLFLIWLPQAHRQSDNAPKEESLTILEPNDKVPNQESLGLGLACLFFYLATTSLSQV